MRVIPAIDLLDGKAVRLHQGRYDQVTVYDADPPARARAWRGKVDRLHVVDLAAAKSGGATQTEVVGRIIEAFGDGVQVGGGVRTRADFERWLSLGASRVVLGTAAARDPELVRALANEHPDTVIVAVDAKDGMVATDGWTKTTTVSAIELARRFAGAPIAGVLYTDVARDGTRAGPNVEMTAKLAREAGVSVIASGGIGSLDDLRALCAHPGIDAAIVGRAIYDGVFTLEDAVAAARALR
jgi:phosphoribosylformimino-5-aminoimidazole carboxamide ribotide isomerase